MDDTLHRLVRMKGLLTLMAVAYLAPMVLGAILVAGDVPGFRELQARALAAVLRAGPIPTIARLLGEGRLLSAIALTFAWNLGVAACIGSIAIGVLLPLPPLIAVLRGLLIGLVFADQLRLTFAHGLVMGGTFVLEIGAYVMAGALGLRLGIALLPHRGKAPPVRERLAKFLAELRDVLPVVALLLLLGAIWENIGLFLLGRLH